MRRPAGDVDGAAGRDQRLPDHLSAKHALPAGLRRAAAEQVQLELFEVEDGEEVIGGRAEDIAPPSATSIAACESRDDAIVGLQEAAVATSSQGGQRFDVLIGGAGFAGLALAIALRQGLGPSFSVAVADPALGRAPADARASAIVAAARRLFETIGVWDKVADDAQPILDMVITDSRLQDAVRPTFLTFDGEVEPGEPFAHMIENGPLLAALVEKAKEEGIELLPVAVASSVMPLTALSVTSP